MNRCAWMAAVLCLVGASAQAEIYTWVDAQGARHYSDSPGAASAERANLPGLQAADGNADALSELQGKIRAGNAAAGRPPVNDGDPRTTVITQPEDGQTFRDAQGRVPVAVTLDGSNELKPDEQIVYFLDGRPIPHSPTMLTRLTLGNVARGSHTLSAALIHQGSALKRTSPLTFHMQPPSAISPLNTGQNGNKPGNADTPGMAGSAVAPPAGNTAGVPAAPRFNTGSGAAGSPSS